MTIIELRPDHVDALSLFFAELPAGDLTFIEEDVSDPAQVRSLAVSARGRWLRGRRPGARALQRDRVPRGAAPARLVDHVGEIRLVVHPAHRRAGLGRALARHALVQAVGGGLRKLVVELVADQEHAIAMFTALGFTGEALLRDHIRDRDGRLRDLVVLARFVEQTWAAMATVGLQEEMLQERSRDAAGGDAAQEI